MLLRLILISLLFCSCSSRMIQTDLYFAQIRPDRTSITDAEWIDFKEKYISKVFINGSTTHSTVGNWLDPETGVLITEPSFVVSYIYKRSPILSKQIDSLRSTYQRLFHQQSVLRVDKKVKARF